MYTVKNYKTKKELKQDITNGVVVRFYQPGPFGGNEPKDGTITLEGPHYPAPHRWYATAKVEGGKVVSVK